MNKYYLEILNYLHSGELSPGAELPPVGKLADRFQASEEEIQVALSELIYEGEIERERAVPSSKIISPKRKLWGSLGGSHSITKESKKRGEIPGS